MAQPQTVEAPALSAISTPLSAEAGFVDLVDRARGLKAVVDRWISEGMANTAFATSTPFLAFKGDVEDLSRRNMAAHLDLKARGTDGDLTCILRGISEDLPKKIAGIEEAVDTAQRATALEELSYLLNDNVEVILAPPVTP